MAKSPRILFHPGFHKTGTTSLQSYLENHEEKISDWFSPYIHMGQAGPKARYFGHKSLPWRLWAFRQALRTFLATIPGDKPIFMSRETFCGVMPGHHALGGKLILSYQAAADSLLRVTFAELRRRFGQNVEIELLMTIRDHDRWLRSVYGHLLRTYRVKADFDDWKKEMSGMPNLEEQARNIASKLPHAGLHIRKLEDFATASTGMAQSVFELMGVPETIVSELPKATRENVGSTKDLEQSFLELNRSNLSLKALNQAKTNLIKKASSSPRS